MKKELEIDKRLAPYVLHFLHPAEASFLWRILKGRRLSFTFTHKTTRQPVPKNRAIFVTIMVSLHSSVWK